MKLLKPLLFLALLSIWSCQKETNRSICDQQIDDLKINQLQYLASQNSYRMQTYEPLYNAIDKGLGLFSKYKQPAGWDYSHETLEDQLNKHNIRGLEFDIYYDPDGGLFYHRAGNRLVGEPTASSIPELNDPGFKILHQPDFDYMSHHYTFKSALEAVKNWSDANKNHLPLTILVEPKDDAYVSAATLLIPGDLLTRPKLITPAALDFIDKEIEEIFGKNAKKIITPDEVRGDFETLEEAILTSGWPKLKDARGKIMFVLANSGFEKSYYLNGHPSLTGRQMFTFSKPGKAECAFVRFKKPEKDLDEIQDLVAKGYMVSTLAEDGTKAAKEGDETQMTAAFASGAQLIATHYYRPDERYKDNEDWTNYSVQFPSGELAIVNFMNGDSSLVNCGVRE